MSWSFNVAFNPFDRVVVSLRDGRINIKRKGKKVTDIAVEEVERCEAKNRMYKPAYLFSMALALLSLFISPGVLLCVIYALVVVSAFLSFGAELKFTINGDPISYSLPVWCRGKAFRIVEAVTNARVLREMMNP